MVQTLPNNYFLREHNREVYVTEKIHKDLHFLDLFPMVNNEYGEFTQYITDANADTETENPRGVNEGVTFAEINFGKPSMKRGALSAKGFKFSWTSKTERQGRLNANMRIWLSKAVSRLANFYDKKFADAIMAAANATAPNDLSDWDDSTSFDPKLDELKIIDAFETDDFGFKPTDVYLNHADYLRLQTYIASFPYDVKFNLNYHNFGTAISEGAGLVLSNADPIADIEKYVNPDFSTIRQTEIAAEKKGKELKNVPESFINVWYPPVVDKPDVKECFLWAESAVNVLETKGAMVIDINGS